MIVGVDEVGRGCWAGPVVAGAVLLDSPLNGLKDSKKLSRLQRERLDADIRVMAIAFGLGWVGPEEIDKIGLTAAVGLAMEQALAAILSPYDQIIVDGNYNFFAGNPKSVAVIGADGSVPAVSAASIIAKVARDKYMAEAATLFPGYGFERHVGYGTAQHLEAIKSGGITKLHRLSFKPVRELAL